MDAAYRQSERMVKADVKRFAETGGHGNSQDVASWRAWLKAAHALWDSAAASVDAVDVLDEETGNRFFPALVALVSRYVDSGTRAAEQTWPDEDEKPNATNLKLARELVARELPKGSELQIVGLAPEVLPWAKVEAELRAAYESHPESILDALASVRAARENAVKHAKREALLRELAELGPLPRGISNRNGSPANGMDNRTAGIRVAEAVRGICDIMKEGAKKESVVMRNGLDSATYKRGIAYALSEGWIRSNGTTTAGARYFPGWVEPPARAS